MEIEAPDIAAADAIAGLWVDLAREQRAHGSQLSAEANQAAIRESIVQGIVTGGVLVARAEEPSLQATRDGIDGGAIVGFVTFGPDTGRYEREVPRGTIRNLYVVPEHRNAGVGSALLDAAEEALAAAGMEAVALESMADNQAARRFYRRHGYTPHRMELSKPVESDTH